jgi:hypothetical protein
MVLALIKAYGTLIGNRFEIGNKPYRQRYVKGKTKITKIK